MSASEKKSDFSYGAGGLISKQILLLGDDGRMKRLLERESFGEHVVCEAEVLEGIVRLGSAAVARLDSDTENELKATDTKYDLVLLNVERLGAKTVQAVKALRRVRPKVPVVLYGEAFAEVYAQPALREGAKEFLVWPIPRAELRSELDGVLKVTHIASDRVTMQRDEKGVSVSEDLKLVSKEQSKGAETDLRWDAKMVGQFHRLAELVPKGQGVLVEQAQKVSADMLQVEWARIDLLPAKKQVKGQEQKHSQNFAIPEHTSQIVQLAGPMGMVGRMILGPVRKKEQTSEMATSKQSADEVSSPVCQFTLERLAGFLGILIHLVQRDEALKKLAMTDDLTGAHNRRYLEHFLRQILKQMSEEKTEVTLLLFDIDDFKHYNDTYGHGTGDEILRQTTRLIRRCCREHDVVARIGGDEFAVLFWDSRREKQAHKNQQGHEGQGGETIVEKRSEIQGTQRSHQEMVKFLSNRFRRMMMTNEFPGLGPEARGVLTISGGLSSFPWDGQTVEALMAASDEALLSAKRSGKNRIYLLGRPDNLK